MIENLDDLNETQQASLKKFREQVQSSLKEDQDDFFLLKWLQATDFDAGKAEDMFRQSLWLRKKLDLDSVLTPSYTPPEVLLKYDPGGFYGYDKEGSPIFVDPLGQIDFKGLLHSVKRDDVLRFKGYHAEKGLQLAREKAKETGNKVFQVNNIIDMEGLGLKHLWGPGVALFNSVATLYENNFPGYWKRIFIVKAPLIFPAAYNLVKPFLSEDTKNKVKILGDDWKEQLKKYIDEDNLPEFYGGKGCDDKDPKCSSEICYGGTIPESYYLAKTPFGKSEGSTLVTVDRGKHLDVEKNVEESGSTISWEFRTKEHDIGFGIYLSAATLEEKDEMEEILPIQRVSSQFVPEVGSLKCECPGKYIVRFDNSYSWVTKKAIEYRIVVTSTENNSTDNN